MVHDFQRLWTVLRLKKSEQGRYQIWPVTGNLCPTCIDVLNYRQENLQSPDFVPMQSIREEANQEYQGLKLPGWKERFPKRGQYLV